MMEKCSILAAAFLCFCWSSSTAAKNDTLKEVKDDRFRPGQVWSYKTRPDDPGSTLTILRVEEAPLNRRIVHIHVDGIHLKNCTGGPEPDTVGHMPFERRYVADSVIENLRTGPVPDFQAGYKDWRRGWDAGKAGFYTIPVSQAIDVMQITFSKGLNCP
jgi:hypothetical protein